VRVVDFGERAFDGVEWLEGDEWVEYFFVVEFYFGCYVSDECWCECVVVVCFVCEYLGFGSDCFVELLFDFLCCVFIDYWFDVCGWVVRIVLVQFVELLGELVG